MGYFKVFEEGYRRKVRQNYRDIKNVEGASKRSILLTPRHNKDLHSGTFSKGLKDTFNHIGYQVQNLFNFKSNRKPLAPIPMHPAVANILNTKPLGKSSWFKLGQVHTVLTGGKTNVYDNSKYRPIELSVNRQVQLNKPQNRFDRKIIAKAKRINIVRKVLNKITSGFEKLISFAPGSIQNAYGKFKSGVRKEFIRSYRNKIREEVAKESDRAYRAVDRKMSKVTGRNIVIEAPNRPIVRMTMGLADMAQFKKDHTKRVVREKQKQILKRAHLKGLISSVKLRAKAMGKVGLVFAAAALAGYGIKQLLTSGNKLKAKVTKSLVGRLEHNKRISEGLKKSTKIKHNRK